jgi:hypothetical protein
MAEDTTYETKDEETKDIVNPPTPSEVLEQITRISSKDIPVRQVRLPHKQRPSQRAKQAYENVTEQVTPEHLQRWSDFKQGLESKQKEIFSPSFSHDKYNWLIRLGVVGLVFGLGFGAFKLFQHLFFAEKPRAVEFIPTQPQPPSAIPPATLEIE